MTTADEAARCDVGDASCLTCGDVALPLTVRSVRSVRGGVDAECVDDAGRAEHVATDLVGPVAPGDRLLVHAGVAIARITEEEVVSP